MAKFKVGDQFTDLSSPVLGFATVTKINKRTQQYEVIWSKENLPGARNINDPDLRPLTKLEKVLK